MSEDKCLYGQDAVIGKDLTVFGEYAGRVVANAGSDGEDMVRNDPDCAGFGFFSETGYKYGRRSPQWKHIWG